MLKGFAAPYPLRSVAAPFPGRAAACNAGVAAAAGEVLVLLDDDMEVGPTFVASHRRHHPPGSRLCVLGPVPVRPDGQRQRAATYVGAKFAAHLARLAQTDHEFSVRDFYSGNASLRLEVMREIGGFDESFTAYGNEDVELALRLRAAGVTLRFDPEAVANQTYDKSLGALLRDTRAKGATTVRLARMHPEIFESLRLANPEDASRLWLTARPLLLRLARSAPRSADGVFALAALLERSGLWRQPLFYRAALDYAFWVGADAELDGTEDFPDLAELARRLRPQPRSVTAGALEERIALSAPARRLRFRLTTDIVDRYAGSRAIRLLDGGCGDGLLALMLARCHPDWTVIGLDLRDDLLAGARERARARLLGNVSFGEADLTQPLPASGFDVVLAVECLSEIPDDERALSNLAAALVPGGLLVVHVPERSWRAVLRSSPSTWRDQVRQGYSEPQLRKLLETAGVDVVEVRPTYRAVAAIAQEVRDRLKSSHLAVRVALFPAFAAAAWLEYRGVAFGRPKAFMAVAVRASAPGASTLITAGD
jgi:trans-aconitate methyltransferase